MYEVLQMKSKLQLVFTVILLIALFLTSCSSIYVDAPAVTTEALIEVDLEKEYFTTGSLYTKATALNGFIYGDSWVYVESCPYKNGTIDRIVKANAVTGTVSSVCLDPVCNHSPGSECPMLQPEDVAILSLNRLIGDWILYSHLYMDEGFSYNETYAYNLKTGESANIFEMVENELSITKWQSIFDVGSRIYSVRSYLDYSESGYDPKGNKPIKDYTPKTTSFLCYYDFDTKETVELFEIPNDYTVTAITNKRYFLSSRTDGIYSCDLNGNGFKKEDVFDFSSGSLCGPYAYTFVDEGVKIYDVSSDTVRIVPVDIAGCVGRVTDAGIMISGFSTVAEWLALEYKDFCAAHPEIPVTELRPAYSKERNRIMYSGKAQVWRIDLEGGEKELYFEYDHAHIRMQHAANDHAFAIVTYGDPQNNYEMLPIENEGRSIINLKTGEIKTIPYLELIINEE